MNKSLKESLTICGMSTARAGSKSVPYKNEMMIRGRDGTMHPLYLHNLIASLSCPEIERTYISTDIAEASKEASKWGYEVITRPPELCQDNSTHDDTIKHGLLEIERRLCKKVDILVVMLGNTMNVIPEDVTRGIQMLEEDPEADSVVTVVKLNHFNPIRAYIAGKGKGNEKKYLDTFIPQGQIHEMTKKMSLSDKNSVGDIYFQNGLWFLRRHAIIEDNGILPFKWFGKKVRYFLQDPSLQEIDDNYQVKLFL